MLGSILSFVQNNSNPFKTVKDGKDIWNFESWYFTELLLCF